MDTLRIFLSPFTEYRSGWGTSSFEFFSSYSTLSGYSKDDASCADGNIGSSLPGIVKYKLSVVLKQDWENNRYHMKHLKFVIYFLRRIQDCSKTLFTFNLLDWSKCIDIKLFTNRNLSLVMIKYTYHRIQEYGHGQSVKMEDFNYHSQLWHFPEKGSQNPGWYKALWF